MIQGYKEIWVVDFEYHAPAGETPSPICMVGLEVLSHRIIRLGPEDLASSEEAPFETGPDALLVAYYAPAEMGCFLSLGWSRPSNILDLCAEFRWYTSGNRLVVRKGLVEALRFFKLDEAIPVEKEQWRQLAMRGAPFSPQEVSGLLDYCQEDVMATAKLLHRMSNIIDFDRAFLRGLYCHATALMERSGIPVDLRSLTLLRDSWEALRVNLVAASDTHCLFEGTTFKMSRFEAFLRENGIPWPRLESGALCTKEDTFRQKAKAHPDRIAPIHELRTTLNKLKLNKLAVGLDGRNRTMLSPFVSKTGRNQPSTTAYIFGPATWIRGLIKPPEGSFIAYVDWSQQELGIAACLSGDRAMCDAYRSGDPYLSFAKMAGAVPEDATKQSHPKERAMYKQCMLAVNYGMGAKSLANTAGLGDFEARHLLRKHRDTFPTYWDWSDRIERQGFGEGVLRSVFGWQCRVDSDSRPSSVRNFPLQANGAEMLRLAILRMQDEGVNVVAPVHDAVMVEAPIGKREEVVKKTQKAMRWASEQVLPGFPLESDVKVVEYPDRYMDEERGADMWNKVMGIVGGPPFLP